MPFPLHTLIPFCKSFYQSVNTKMESNMNSSIILLLYWFTSNIIALKIYQSNVGFQNEKVISGLFYKKQTRQNIILSQNMTICVRFNFKRLSHLSQIIAIKNSNSQNDPNFLRIRARYPESWINFGNSEHGTGSKSSWILHDPKLNSYSIWETYKWHHICFSFLKMNSFISLVKVRT